MKTLLLDIETAPHRVYAWGLWNQDIAINQIEEPGYTLCWAAKWYGDKDVLFSSIHEDGKQLMLHLIWDMLHNADAVIHYNGTKFDIPTLNQEFLSAGFGKPAPYKQIDLLRTARKQFRLPSNKLDYVASYLGLGGKVKHKGMELWRKCMAGDEEAWEVMQKYNEQDVKLLEQVYERLLPWIDGHPNASLYTDLPDMRCTKCGSVHLQKRGFSHTQTMTYQRFQCMSCGSWLRSRSNVLTAEKRKNILVEAK